MDPQSNLGEVARANLPSQLVKPNPSSKCQLVHHRLRMGQIIQGLPKCCALHRLHFIGHILFCLHLFPHFWGCEDCFLMWSCLQVGPLNRDKI